MRYVCLASRSRPFSVSCELLVVAVGVAGGWLGFRVWGGEGGGGSGKASPAGNLGACGMHTCVCQMNMISHNVNRNRDVGGGVICFTWDV